MGNHTQPEWDKLMIVLSQLTKEFNLPEELLTNPVKRYLQYSLTSTAPSVYWYAGSAYTMIEVIYLQGDPHAITYYMIDTQTGKFINHFPKACVLATEDTSAWREVAWQFNPPIDREVLMWDGQHCYIGVATRDTFHVYIEIPTQGE